MVANLLGDEYDWHCATTWEHAERRLHETPPDAIIVGYHFDEMRPYRFVRHVREHDHETPVLVVRGLPLFNAPRDEDEVRRAYRLFGADDYVVLDKAATGKTFRDAATELRCLIDRLMRGREEVMALRAYV